MMIDRVGKPIGIVRLLKIRDKLFGVLITFLFKTLVIGQTSPDIYWS